MPPLNETRFPNDEVVFQLGGTVATQLERLRTPPTRARGHLAARPFGLLGRTVFRFRITGGRHVRGIIARAADERRALLGAAELPVRDGAGRRAGALAADTSRKGDSAQYIVEKLGLPEAHLIATGKDVKVAVIDSEIDAKHPDLAGAITGTYDALPSDDQTAHPHGTGMAGAIASHQRLLGVAPGARLLGVRAFGVEHRRRAGHQHEHREGPGMGGGAGREGHQHELRRPERSDPRTGDQAPERSAASS